MGGGLMQLVAYGAQDIYLTGNPQITFFKVVYRRHTNFAMECIQQTINGSSTISATAATTGTVTISRNGDLVGRVYVRCDQETSDGISGDGLITDVTLEIGGQQIDKHTKEWLQLYAELTIPESKANGYKYLTGGFSNTLVSGGLIAAGGTQQQSIMVPLQFFFCRNPGLALPLIALQYHEVKLKFNWAAGSTGGGLARAGGSTVTPSVEVWTDYFYLDTDERRRFAQVSHEYLIEQLQYQENSSAAVISKQLNFNHPVKELIWTTTSSASTGLIAQKTKLTLNGHDRFAEQDREYFQIRQPLDHHTSVPAYNIKETEHVTMLSKHLPAGAADLDTYITYASNTDKVSAGVVDIGTAAGTNPVIGDLVKVTELAPIMLNTPIDFSVAAGAGVVINGAGYDTHATVTAAASGFAVSNTFISLGGADGVTGDMDIRVGDLIKVEISLHDDAGSVTAAELCSAITTVTAVTLGTGNDSANAHSGSGNNERQYALLTVSPSVQCITVASTTADVIPRLYVIGRRGNVEVGTGVVTAVATTGTDFTLSNNDIVTKQNFKLHIVGRVQSGQSRCSSLAKEINCYSFALKPEEHQPSGTCNFSRIDNAYLKFSASVTSALNIYAVNYNVLRVMSGMGGLAYSN